MSLKRMAIRVKVDDTGSIRKRQYFGSSLYNEYFELFVNVDHWLAQFMRSQASRTHPP